MIAYEVLHPHVQGSDEWHAARQSFIGASDVPAILGLSPWQTPLSVYMTKMGVRNEIPEDLAWFGHALEPVIAGWLEHKHPEVGSILDGFSARSTAWPWLAAAPDRTTFAKGDTTAYIPIELKTSSAYSKDSWADGVPLYYAAQVQTQIAVLDAPYGWLAVLHGGNTPHLYRIERDDDFINNYLIPRTREFWENHVLAQVPPEPSTSAEAVELWPGNPELTIDGGEALEDAWGAYGLLQAEAIDIAQQLDGMKLELQKAMQDATTLTNGDRVLFTWNPRKGSTRFDATKFKKDHPDIAAEYTTQGEPTRVFVRKTVKEVDQ